MKKKLSRLCFRIVRWLVWLFYPRINVEGMENVTEEPVMYVGNHSQMNGPITAELYFPGDPYIWCAGQMMHLKEVPAYAYADFWSEKPKAVRWFYKLLSYVIAPLSVSVFTNARTIGVYKDARAVNTFKQSVKMLTEGTSQVIFPEHAVPHNNIVYDFQDKFIDAARLYYRKTGKELCFVPVYLAPKLKTLYIGKPTRFRGDAPIEEERGRICTYLMSEITKMAEELPRHTVIPYRNIPRKDYPTNK